MAEEFIDFLPLYADQTEAVIRARWDAWANEGLTVDQVSEWTDTRQGSFFYIATQPGVREAARIYDLMGSEVPAASNPLWAWEQYLDDHAAVVDVDRTGSTVAEGDVVFTGVAGTIIPAGFTVTVTPAADTEEPPEFATILAGTIPAAAAAPAGLSATVQTGGTLTFSTTYRYVVTALDDAGETIASAEVNGVIAASGLLRQILLDWADTPSAVSYNVYRKTGATGPPYDFLVNVSASTFTDTGAIATNGAIHPPVANTTGLKLKRHVVATEAGIKANVGAGAVNAFSTPPADGLTVTNPSAMAGGAETQTDDALRDRVLDAYVGRGAGNVKDYERWGLEEPGVGRVVVLPLWSGAGTVKVVIMTAAGGAVSSTIIASLQARLDPVAGLGHGLAPIGAVVTVDTATALNITVDAPLEPEPGYSLDGFGGTIAIAQRIKDAVEKYVESVGPGGEVVRAQVAGRIANVVGVHDVDLANVKLNTLAANVAIPAAPPRIAQILAINLTAVVL